MAGVYWLKANFYVDLIIFNILDVVLSVFYKC